MLERAVRICDSAFGNIYRWDGEALQHVAGYNTRPHSLRHADAFAGYPPRQKALLDK
jgi:hypothetical protein